MPVAINLHNIIVSGWKGIDSRPVNIDFNGESWLIHGDNEVGKSSIFSALRTALFERTDVRSAYADNWVNNRCASADIEVELYIDGEPYTIFKTRSASKKGNTILYQGFDENGRKQVSNGVDAVNDILELIGAKSRTGAGSRGDELPQNWGILAWLMAPQGMDSVSPAREHGTHTIGLEKSVSEEMTKIEEYLSKSLFEEISDKTGKPTSNGDLKQTIDSLATAKSELDEILSDRIKYTEVIQEIVRIKNNIDVSSDKLSEAEINLINLQDFKIDIKDKETEIATLKGKKDVKNTEIENAREKIENLKNIDDELKKRMKELTNIKKNIGVKVDEKNKKIDLINILKIRYEKLTQSNQEIQDDIISMQKTITSATFNSQIKNLKEKVKKLNEIETEINILKDSGAIFESLQLEEMQDIVNKLDRAEAMIAQLSNSLGVSVTSDGPSKIKWNIDGLEIKGQKNMKFAQQMDIIGKDFKIFLNRDLGENGNWVQDRIECSTFLEKYDLNNSDELRKKVEKETKRNTRLNKLDYQKKLVGDIKLIKAELKNLSKLNSNKIEEFTSIEILTKKLKKLENEKEKNLIEVNKLKIQIDPLELENKRNVEALQSLRAKENAEDKLTENCAKRRDDEIGENGTMNNRKKLLKDLEKDLKELNKSLDYIVKLKNTEVGAQDDALKQAKRVKKGIENDLMLLNADLMTRNREEEELGNANIQQATESAQIKFENKKKELENIKYRVDSESRLVKRFQDSLTNATELEIAPIKNQVETWLAQVTQGMWTEIEMDSKLNVTKLSGPNRTIDGEDLSSGGLRQTIHALIRLSVACKVYDDRKMHVKNLPSVSLIMDESQGFVDQNRTLRLSRIFNQEIAAGRVQVIAISHRKEEFQSLNAINYDVGRRLKSDYRDV